MELSAELSFGVGPVHRLLGAGFHAGLRLLQLLFVPAGRFVALAPAHNGIPELLERAELLFPGHALNGRRGHRGASLPGCIAGGKRRGRKRETAACRGDVKETSSSGPP